MVVSYFLLLPAMDYDEKKQLLMHVLSQLKNVWSEAQSLYTLLLLTNPAESALDEITEMIEQTASSISDDAAREATAVFLEKMQVIRQRELEERQAEQQAALSALDNL